ncbi:MAG: 4'-phosphopantetheinyl transferase family protein, partial [Sporomusa sp.]
MKERLMAMISGNAHRLVPHIRITEFDESQVDLLNSLILADGEVHIWQTFTRNFQSYGKELTEILSREESARLDRFYFQRDKARFFVAHGILRILIGRYLNISPRLVDFRYGPNGKPELNSHYGIEPLSFNISHSHNLVAFAFAKYRNLGIDVEHIRPMPDY